MTHAQTPNYYPIPTLHDVVAPLVTMRFYISGKLVDTYKTSKPIAKQFAQAEYEIIGYSPIFAAMLADSAIELAEKLVEGSSVLNRHKERELMLSC